MTSITKVLLQTMFNRSLSDNKRIVSTSAAKQLKFQTWDNQGTFATHDWKDVATIDINTSTKKAKSLSKIRCLLLQLLF